MRVIKSVYERVVFAVLSDFASFIYSQERGRYLDFHLEIWYNACVKSIKQRIKGVLSSDEEIYKTADELSAAANSADLKKAIDIFKSISDYSDAGHRANELQTKYEEMLQYEKEQAILKKEAKYKKK